MNNQTIFLNEKHLQRYENLEVKGFIQSGEYSTACYILSAFDTIYSKARAYISYDGIGFKRMLNNEVLSNGENTIVKLAANLFNSLNESPPAIDIASLSDDFYECAMTAMKIYHRGGKIFYQTDQENIFHQTM